MNYLCILFFPIIQNYLKISILCSECDIKTPILTQKGCKLIYCSEEQFNSGECSKNNTIIKTQWLNNIISFNNYNMRYGNLAVNSNGDMILECSNHEANGKRLFYGLKKNGNFYFKNGNEERIPSIFITINGNNASYPIRYESSSIFVTINNTECLLSISMSQGNAELYDFESGEISYVSTFDFTGYNIESTSNTLLKIEKDQVIEYFFTFNGQIKEDGRYIYFYNVLQKYSFTKNKISFKSDQGDGYTIIHNKTIGIVNRTRIVSSFITQSNIIVLFYLNNTKFVIELFNENLHNLNSTILDYFKGEEEFYYDGIFNKCIHIKKNIGAFLYYINNYDSTPHLKIININDDYSFKLKFSYELNISNEFISDTLLNNFLKINNNKFASIISSKDRNKLFIVLYEFYNSYQNIKIRTYKINLYELYNYKIYLDLSSILYNDYLVLYSSVCNALSCNDTNYFSFLIIFGYVNGSNTYINISHFLSEFNIDNNKNNIIDIILENITIDNNIFGYELQKKVKLVYIPEELIFYNIINDERIKVNSNEFLYYEHNITQNNIINMSNKEYYFEFQSIVQGPTEETKINQYAIDIRSINCLDNDNIEEDENIQNSTFYSRTIKVEFKLCYELCNTCKSLGISFNDQKCLSCLENYTYIEGNCYQKGIDYEYFELCSYEYLLNQKCNLNDSIKNNNTIIYNIIKNVIKYYTGNDNLIFKSEDNYVFQLTNSLNEENTKNGVNENTFNLSMIELGECEDILKEINQINKNTPLIIYKKERLYSTASQKNIQYEVYNPDTKEKLDLSACSNEKINIYIPLMLSEETLELQQDLLSYGYDLFNPNDSFYQDICSGYTSSNGTDVLLSDRRIYYFNNTQTACQKGCEYSEYNSETQQLKCECSVDEEDIDPEKEVEFDGSIIFLSFYDVLKYSNFLILKCYKSIFNFKGLLNNWGSIIVFIFFLFYSLFNLMYFVNGFYYIKLYSAKMIFNKNKNNNNNDYNNNNDNNDNNNDNNNNV